MSKGLIKDIKTSFTHHYFLYTISKWLKPSNNRGKYLQLINKSSFRFH